ncbi:MAG: putative major facilitator superfamily transporter [Pseudonocardiales bacterium]|nr:putative major facilitator superfamily transporter [Pseudonocardiales bacterium]
MTSLETAADSIPPPTSSGPESATFIRGTAWSRATWALLIVLCGALFLDGLDISMVGVALPSIGADLHMGAGSLQWIVSGYVLGYGGLLLLGGRASDLLGRRPVFLVAVAVFGLASVVSTFLSNDTALIALRFVKGASAAFTVPAGLSIITTTFAEGPARNRAFSIYTVCGASGFSMGLVFGGLLTEIGWRATFLLPGPVAIALVLIGIRVIPRAARQRVELAHFDLAGAFTSTTGLLLLVYAVVEAPSRGWGSPVTIGLLLLSVALMAAFVQIERRHPRPLLRLGILRSSALVHANLSGAVMFGGYVAFQFVVTLYVQDSLGWSPIAMSLGFLPAGLIVVASATRMGAVLERYNTTVLILGGLTALLVGYLLFLRVSPSMSYWNFLLPTMVLLGIGFALCFPSVNAQATAGIEDHEQGLASGLVNTSIQIGGAVVLAAITAIIGGGSASTARPGELLPGMTTAIAVVSGVSVLGLVLTVVRLAPWRSLGRAGQASVEPAAVAVPELCEAC